MIFIIIITIIIINDDIIIIIIIIAIITIVIFLIRVKFKLTYIFYTKKNNVGLFCFVQS